MKRALPWLLTALMLLTACAAPTKEAYPADVTSIDAYRMGVTDVSEFAAYPELRKLNLSGNAISDITPIVKLTKLEELDLSYTAITNDSLRALKEMPGLKKLRLRETDVTRLPDGLSQLEELDCMFCDITCIPHGLTSLQKLEAGNCALTDITALADCKQLYDVNLNNNQLTDIGVLSELCALTQLTIARNPGIADVAPIAALTKLTRLDVSCLPIDDLSPAAGLSKLHYLDVSDTDVTDISALKELSRLVHLTLTNTGVCDLNPLASLERLRELDISGTRVTDITPLYLLDNAPYVSAYETALTDEDAQAYAEQTGASLAIRHLSDDEY